MPNIYWDQIKTILVPGLGCMGGRTIATDEGVFEIDLSDYQSVKRLHDVIAAVLDGWERDATGQWKVPYQKRKDRAMPPYGPLRVEDVDAFLTCVQDGMPENPTMT